MLVTGGSGRLGQLVLEELLHVRKVPGRYILTTFADGWQERLAALLAGIIEGGVDPKTVIAGDNPLVGAGEQ